jgi:hypothetical protein
MHSMRRPLRCGKYTTLCDVAAVHGLWSIMSEVNDIHPYLGVCRLCIGPVHRGVRCVSRGVSEAIYHMSADMTKSVES